MTLPRPCRTCSRPIRWVGGFKRPVDSEPMYFVVDPAGQERALMDSGAEMRGHFGRVKPGEPWVVGYKLHVCPGMPAPQVEKGCAT